MPLHPMVMNRMRHRRLATLATLAPALLSAQPARTADIARATATITAPPILQDIRTLASDAFEGRAPGTRGEDSSVAFLQREFRRIGLKPGNPNGSYIQPVPLVGTTSVIDARVNRGGTSTTLKALDDIVAWSLRPDTLVTVKPADMARFETIYSKYGRWSLLASWVPFFGDPLTLAAGVARTPLIWFVPLVAIAKGARYGVVAAIASQIF